MGQTGLKTFAAAALLAIAVPSISHAELEIKGIMKGIGERTEEVVRAINKGDFESVRKNALLIADHPKPSITERARILGFLMTDTGDFKASDETVHSAAKRLSEAAEKKDYNGVIEGFAGVLKGCSGCHEKYRQRIIDNFYKETK